MDILEVKSLSLRFNGKAIIKNISLGFRQGAVHAVVGANGAGKSSLAYTLMGLTHYRQYDGEILFNGSSIKDKGLEERAKLGITLGWQEPARFEGLSIKEFIKAADRNITDEGIGKVLSLVGYCDDYKGRKVDKTLSGGERKKIELASIIAMKPKFVILDEPDSGIDISSMENIFDAIKHLKEHGSTVVLVTHSLAVLEQAEYACLLCGGSLIDQGRMEKIRPYFENKCIVCTHPNVRGEHDH